MKAKCATTLVLVDIILSNYVPTNGNILYSINHPTLAWNYFKHFVIFFWCEKCNTFLLYYVVGVSIALGGLCFYQN